MVWDIVLKKLKFPPSSQISYLHLRLLLSYLSVIGAIFAVFSTGTYLFVSHSFYQQLDRRLLTLAQAATPSHTQIQKQGSDYLETVNEVPWRDIFNRDDQSLEWFDTKGRLLATRGELTVDDPPETGTKTRELESSSYQIRSYTISVFRDPATSSEPTLEGYIRASQSTKDIETSQQQLLWGLITGGSIALGVAAAGGVWLTRKALAPVESNLQQLRQFTADASHELRTPLAAIKSSVEVMQNHPERVHPKDAKKLSAIASATEQMGSLIENLLFLARADTNQNQENVSWRVISLKELLLDVVELFETTAEAEEISLNTEISTDAHVLGDVDQLNRLFANLVRNGLQYTPKGGSVTIKFTASNRTCSVSVIDTGVGIDPQDQPLVFERFWRGDRARSQSQSKVGSGLGLPIARTITEKHGGRITLHSQPSNGSRFTVRLPLAQQTEMNSE